MSLEKHVFKKEKRPDSNAKIKNVSIRELAGKVIGTVREKITNTSGEEPKKRKPFGGKGGRKRKPTETELKRAEELAKLDEIDKEQSEQDNESERTYSNIASAFNSFFYTDEKFITQFEDKEILEYVKARHPEYDPKSNNESAMRKTVLSILDDSRFVSGLLQRYGMSIFDFFMFMFRMEPSVFRGAFIQKVQKAIRWKKYASAKRHCYRFSRKQNGRKRK